MNTMNGTSDSDAFCQGPGRVMLPGFQFSFNPTAKAASSSCVLWLFPKALVDTPGKYAAAVIGTFLLAVVFELLRAGRAHLAKGNTPFQHFKEGKTSPFTLDVINSTTYVVQVTIAYCIMLLIMLYEAMIFFAICLGLGTGYFLVLRLNRHYYPKKHNEEANNDVAKEQVLDATHKALSPCCGEEADI